MWMHLNSVCVRVSMHHRPDLWLPGGQVTSLSWVDSVSLISFTVFLRSVKWENYSYFTSNVKLFLGSTLTSCRRYFSATRRRLSISSFVFFFLFPDLNQEPQRLAGSWWVTELNCDSTGPLGYGRTAWSTIVGRNTLACDWPGSLSQLKTFQTR